MSDKFPASDSDAPSPEIETQMPKGGSNASALHDLASEWREKQSEFWRGRRRSDGRLQYRIERNALGKAVRSYHRHNHEPRLLHEGRDEYDARLHRDRERTYRGVSALDVRSWTNLSEMTPGEKLEHNRALAAERKRTQRAKAPDILVSSGEVLSEIDSNLLEVALDDLNCAQHPTSRTK